MPWANTIGLFLTQHWQEQGKLITAHCTNANMEVESGSDRGIRRDPVITFETKEAQQLMDDL